MRNESSAIDDILNTKRRQGESLLSSGDYWERAGYRFSKKGVWYVTPAGYPVRVGYSDIQNTWVARELWAHGLSCADFATLAGLSKKTIQLFRNGQRSISNKLREEFTRIFHSIERFETPCPVWKLGHDGSVHDPIGQEIRALQERPGCIPVFTADKRLISKLERHLS